MTRTWRQGLLVASIAAIIAASPAGAQELVFNGGFETGTFAGWSVPPNVPMSQPNAAHFRIGFGNAHSGDYWAGLSSRQLGYISQILPTTEGQDYELSFWLRRPENIAGRFYVRWEGETIFNPTLMLPDGTNWHRLTFPIHANITGSFLEFGQQTFPLEWHIDDISVVPVPAPSAAPLLLLGSVVALRRRRRR
jgi:hypothetical protein